MKQRLTPDEWLELFMIVAALIIVGLAAWGLFIYWRR